MVQLNKKEFNDKIFTRINNLIHDYNLINDELLADYQYKSNLKSKPEKDFEYYNLLKENEYIALWTYKGYIIMNGKSFKNVNIFKKDKDKFKSLINKSILCAVIADLCFVIYPTMVSRPEVNGFNSLLSLISCLYSFLSKECTLTLWANSDTERHANTPIAIAPNPKPIFASFSLSIFTHSFQYITCLSREKET